VGQPLPHFAATKGRDPGTKLKDSAFQSTRGKSELAMAGNKSSEVALHEKSEVANSSNSPTRRVSCPFFESLVSLKRGSWPMQDRSNAANCEWGEAVTGTPGVPTDSKEVATMSP
jgi:hypothetical protein